MQVYQDNAKTDNAKMGCLGKWVRKVWGLIKVSISDDKIFIVFKCIECKWLDWHVLF